MASMKAKPGAATTRTPKAVVEDIPAPTIEATQVSPQRIPELRALPAVVTAADIEADWDDEAQLTVETLPSGKRVQVHPVSLLSMLANKTLPNSLMNAAKRTLRITGEQSATPAGSDDDDEADETLEQMKLVDYMVCAMCAHPCFVAKPRSDCQPGERSVFEVADTDKMYLFNRAMTGQQALKSGGGQ